MSFPNYTPDFPLGSTTIANSQQTINDNFTTINDQFSADHQSLVGPGDGHHLQVTFDVNTTSSLGSSVGVLYPKSVSGTTSLYFTNAAADSAVWNGGSGSSLVALTGTPATPASPIQMILPNGLIMIWGFIYNAGNPITQGSYNIGAGFPNYCYNLQATYETTVASSSLPTIQLLDKDSFQFWYTGSSIKRIYYFAVGN